MSVSYHRFCDPIVYSTRTHPETHNGVLQICFKIPISIDCVAYFGVARLCGRTYLQMCCSEIDEPKREKQIWLLVIGLAYVEANLKE